MTNRKTLSRFLLDNAVMGAIKEREEPYGRIVGNEYVLRVINTISDGDYLEYLVVQVRPLDRDGDTLFYRISVLYGEKVEQCDYNGDVKNKSEN